MSNDRKPDFSNVQSGANSKPADAGNKPLAGARPDFSNVSSGADTVPTAQGGPGSIGARSYTIEKGDTLSAIAQRVYGKASHWQRIFEANRDTIDNPDRIFPGQVIVLPEIEQDGTGKGPPPSGD
ncbi:LysM peptidoglycan-binding domain-containing protein [Luteimonas composti]|uniref:LysM peptidoglycan-binding domain-containing protein n=1 Tax=Luteimonas composti TaxID=398257 RepID=A0ABT6MUW2_9GAMM|nr:LysM peptidoglycan-binding domain-containing protein [Luteimonas composti]MDH7454425.1 LysM peptidoglycan-binding domain-containing protein [Luteimonas composti]